MKFRVSTILILGSITVFSLVAVIAMVFSLQNTYNPFRDDLSVASNNCCTLPDCANYNGDWEAGYTACANGQCSKCQGGAQPCDVDRICEAGEDGGNCPSDCDISGYSEFKRDTSCNPADVSFQGNDDCNIKNNLKCIACPSNTSSNVGRGFCSDEYSGDRTATSAFISEYCGGLAETPTPTPTPTPAPAPTPTPVSPLPATAEGDVILYGGWIFLGTLIAIIGISLITRKKNT